MWCMLKQMSDGVESMTCYEDNKKMRDGMLGCLALLYVYSTYPEGATRPGEALPHSESGRLFGVG